IGSRSSPGSTARSRTTSARRSRCPTRTRSASTRRARRSRRSSRPEAPMASLKDLRRRIRSTKSMQQIFKAMEMVAAAKLRRAQGRAQAATPYARKITDMLSNLAGAAADLEHPLFKVRPVKTTLLVVITADRGFAGTYNTNILRQAEQRVREAPAGSVQLVV